MKLEKKIEPYLLKLDEIPLLKGDPFSFEELSKALHSSLEKKIIISKHSAKWETADTTRPFIQTCLSFPPLIGNVYFLLEKKDQKNIVEALLQEEIESKELQEDFYTYTLLKALKELCKINPFQKLSSKIIENVQMEVEAYLSLTIKISIENTIFFAKIAITPDFRRSWNEYFSQKDPIYMKSMKQTIHLPLRPVIGAVALDQEELKNISSGDFISLDIPIDKDSCHVQFFLEQEPLFQASLQKTNFKILKNIEEKTMENLLDKEEFLTIELDKISMSLEKILSLQEGNILELSTSLDSPLNICHRGKTIAKGELSQIGEHIGIRILKVE